MIQCGPGTRLGGRIRPLWITHWIIGMIQWFTALESQIFPHWIICRMTTRGPAAAHWIIGMIQCGPLGAAADPPGAPHI
jgi:hypothetical protein